jgi:glycosyltransferase involved in cell wall biosynthesis
MQQAAKIFANSVYTQSTFHKFNPWAVKIPSKIVPLGVSQGFGEHLTDRHEGLSPQVFRILAVGRISKAKYYDSYHDADDLYKGFKNLVLAVGKMARRVSGVELTIVGDGDARPDLEKWLAGQTERETVSLVGSVSDERLRQLYAMSDIFVLPSEGEGFGLVFVEAMSYGLPCVCVDAGAAPEVVENGITGLVARPRDVDDLAAKLLRLASDQVFRAKLGIYARRRFEERYSTKAFQARIIDALEEVIGSSVH